MVANWRKITPEAFVFTAKFPKKITHELKLRDSQAQLERFYKSMSELREKLGPLVIQLPPSFNIKKDKDALEQIMATDSPRIQKGLGRKVRGFNPSKWEACAREIVYRLLTGPQSRRLLQLAMFGGQTHRMVRAVERYLS